MNQKEQIESLELELRGIDEALARIPALDKPTRRENIEHAIRTAGKAHDLETKNTRLEKELETALDDLRKTRMAHADLAIGDKKREKLTRRKRRERYSQEQRDGLHSGGYYHRWSPQREREYKEWEVREKRVHLAVNLTIILLSVVALAAIWFW